MRIGDIGGREPGADFIDLLRQKMPDKVVYSNVGSRFTFGA
mgnify:CR=1 FL=1